MKHNIQRYNECMLAAVCSYTDVDYTTASDLFLTEHGKPWSDACVLTRLAFIQHNFPNHVYQQAIGINSRLQVTSEVAISSDRQMLRVDYFRTDGTKAAHAIAVEGDIIYDSDCTTPIDGWDAYVLDIFRRIQDLKTVYISDANGKLVHTWTQFDYLALEIEYLTGRAKKL